MTKKPKYWLTAKKYLSNKDKIMEKLIKSYKSPSEVIGFFFKNLSTLLINCSEI